MPQHPKAARPAQNQRRDLSPINRPRSKSGHGKRVADHASAAFELPGQLNINSWQHDDYRADLRQFMYLYGYVGANDFSSRCSETIKIYRFVVINSTFNSLKKRIRHLRRLSQFTPRYIPKILAMWSEPSSRAAAGMEVSTQIQAFSVLKWFWRVHGIKVAKIEDFVKDPELRQSYTREHAA
jgi:hypothetical protein